MSLKHQIVEDTNRREEGTEDEIYRLSDMVIGDGGTKIQSGCPDNSASIPVIDANQQCFGSLVSRAHW